MEQIKSIIKKYIEDNIKVSSRPSENLESLTKITNYFSDLLRSTQDTITYELIDEILLENDVVNALLASIMKKYLPYIEENSKNIEKIVKENEPKLALFGGTDGLDCYKQIIKNIKQIIKQKNK